LCGGAAKRGGARRSVWEERVGGGGGGGGGEFKFVVSIVCAITSSNMVWVGVAALNGCSCECGNFRAG